MVTYRFSVPVLPVRFRPLHPIFFVVSCFFLMFSASAVEFDTDSSLYYLLSDSFSYVSPYASALRGNVFDTTFRYTTSGKVSSINYISLSDMTFEDFGQIYAQSLSSIADITDSLNSQISALDLATSSLDSTLNTINSNLLKFYSIFNDANYRAYFYDANGSYSLKNGITFINYLLQLSGSIGNGFIDIHTLLTSTNSFLKTIDSNLAFYLSRIDTNTQNLHGDNLNILSQLSSSFATNHNDLANLLSSNHSDLNTVSNDITSFHNLFTDGNFSIYTWNDISTGYSRNISFPDYLYIMSNNSINFYSSLNRYLFGNDHLTEIVTTSIDENGDIIESSSSYFNILDVLGIIHNDLQSPLSKLQYVLANDDDVKLRAETEKNLNEFDNQFTGSGPGSISPSDIAGVGGISGSLKSSFKDSASAADTFYVINNSQSYQFFSQEVSDSLDTVNNPVVYGALDSDFWLDDFVEDDDGFMSLKSNSAFDPFAFLRGDSD